MIIDAHTHIWSSDDQLGSEIADAIQQRAASRSPLPDSIEAAHVKSMSHVDGALVFGFRSDRLGARIPNELIAEFAAVESRRCIGIAGVDPMSDDASDQLMSGHSLGLAGVTVSPSCQGFHPAHSSAMRVYEQCVGMRMPLFVTSFEPLTSGAVLEFGRPALWDEVAQSFPSLPIVIGGLGYPWVDEALVMLAKHANVFTDIAGVVSRPWALYNALLTASNLGVINKLIFGSGFPYESPGKAIESLYSVNAVAQGSRMPTVPRSLLRSIVERDSLTALGIEAELAPRQTEREVAADRESSDGRDVSIVEFLTRRSPHEAGREPWN
jgi:predicted TIM-barrel fold metal-dependent hydrolase